MAGVRVIAVLAVACRSSVAQPAAPAMPADWRALPELAAAIGVDGARAWGEPARGCYAVDLALRDVDRDDAIAGLRAAGFTIDDAPALRTASPNDAPSLGDDTLAFARGEYHGRARVDAASVRACFWNEREPDACAQACAEVLR